MGRAYTVQTYSLAGVPNVRERELSSELKWIDQLMTHLQGQLARGGMGYDEAVIVDDFISILTAAAEELETRSPDRTAPQTSSP